MNYCYHCNTEKFDLVGVKGMKKEITICLKCRAIMDKITIERNFDTDAYFKFVDTIRQNYDTIKKIKYKKVR